jgi:nitronate monooxygenase
LTTAFEPETVLEACFAHGVRLFYVFWWNGPRLAPRIRRLGGRVFWQVGTPDEACEAADAGADVLVAQGREAGGQVRGPIRLAELLPEVQRAAAHLPVVATGGLADRADVARVLASGACAAMLGTRFVATRESRAAPTYKARLVRARVRDLYLDARPDVGEWPCAPCRRVRSAFGDNGPAWYAGLGVERIWSIPPAAHLVRTLDPASRIRR